MESVHDGISPHNSPSSPIRRSLTQKNGARLSTLSPKTDSKINHKPLSTRSCQTSFKLDEINKLAQQDATKVSQDMKNLLWKNMSAITYFFKVYLKRGKNLPKLYSKLQSKLTEAYANESVNAINQLGNGNTRNKKIYSVAKKVIDNGGNEKFEIVKKIAGKMTDTVDKANFLAAVLARDNITNDEIRSMKEQIPNLEETLERRLYRCLIDVRLSDNMDDIANALVKIENIKIGGTSTVSNTHRNQINSILELFHLFSTQDNYPADVDKMINIQSLKTATILCGKTGPVYLSHPQKLEFINKFAEILYKKYGGGTGKIRSPVQKYAASALNDIKQHFVKSDTENEPNELFPGTKDEWIEFTKKYFPQTKIT